MKLEDLPERFRKQAAAQLGGRASSTRPNVEPDTGNAPIPAHGIEAFASPVRIRFTHIRKRMADLDGLSVKAIIDGLVAAGVLEDDSPEWVKEITHEQFKCNEDQPEEVVIIRITEDTP